MRRRLLCLLALCGLLSGCQKQKPSQPGTPDEASAVPVDDASSLESDPSEIVTYLPESLIQELRDRMQNGTDSYEDLVPLQVGRELSEEEVSVLVPECLNCESAASAVYSSYCAVDFDNDGVEDLFANRRMGTGTTGMFSEEFWRGLPDGSYAQTDSAETYMCDILFITWEYKTYLLTVQHDLLSKSDVSLLSSTSSVFSSISWTFFSSSISDARTLLSNPDINIAVASITTSHLFIFLLPFFVFFSFFI